MCVENYNDFKRKTILTDIGEKFTLLKLTHLPGQNISFALDPRILTEKLTF
jgi:hypothetical protein